MPTIVSLPKVNLPIFQRHGNGYTVPGIFFYNQLLRPHQGSPLTHAVHPGHGGHKFRPAELPGDGTQLLGGLKGHRNALLGAIVQ